MFCDIAHCCATGLVSKTNFMKVYGRNGITNWNLENTGLYLKEKNVERMQNNKKEKKRQIDLLCLMCW